MERSIKVDGERWDVRLAKDSPHPGVRAVVFFAANNQRAYRVVEVPEGRLAGGGLDALGDDELVALFGRSDVMDFVHERKAAPRHETEPADRPENLLRRREGD